MTCWRRLRDWNETGVWKRLHEVLLDRLGEADQLDWSRAAVDAQNIPAAKKGVHRPEPRRLMRPNGSRKTGHKMPSCGRPPLHSFGGDDHRSQPT